MLGAQALGEDGPAVDKRISALAVAIQMGATVYDLEEAELCYAPQFGSAKDAVNFAGMVAADVLDGDMPLAHWDDAKGAFLLDVRQPVELVVESVPGAVNIPLPELRARLGELPRDREILVICRSAQTRLLRDAHPAAERVQGPHAFRGDVVASHPCGSRGIRSHYDQGRQGRPKGRVSTAADRAQSGVSMMYHESKRAATEIEMIVLHGFLTRWPQARFATALGIAWMAAMLGACDRSGDADKAKQAAAAPPPPAVVVAEVVQKTVPIYSEYVAQTDAKETVEIRARVQAFLDAQHFTEGTIVKKDQLLFTLDKREYEAKLQQAKSELDVALAKLGKAETDERRLKPLAERRAVPQQDYDNAAANLLSAQAAVSAARSGVVGAELDLSYCTIRSPIGGLIGKRRVAPGKSRRQGRGHAARYRVERRSDPRLGHHQRGGLPALLGPKAARANGVGVPLELILADGSVFPHKGKMVIVDRAVDTRPALLRSSPSFRTPRGCCVPDSSAACGRPSRRRRTRS